MADNKDVIGTPSFGGDVEPILPDGWEKDDFFAGTEPKDELGLSDGTDEAFLSALLGEDGKPEPDAPTTDDETGSEPDAGEETKETSSDGTPEPEVKPSRKLTLKVNHGLEEVDIDAMSDDDLTALLQKGRAFDQLKEAENKRTYRQVYQQQIDDGQTEAVAKLIAKDAVGGKAYALTDEEEAKAAQTEQPPAAQAAAPVRDFKAEVDQLRALYPDFKEVPDTVAKAVANGVPLLTAYLAYRDQQHSAHTAKLQKENRVLKQNAAAAARAPVKGVTGGDTSAPKEKDIFELGFEAGLKWN